VDPETPRGASLWLRRVEDSVLVLTVLRFNVCGTQRPLSLCGIRQLSKAVLPPPLLSPILYIATACAPSLAARCRMTIIFTIGHCHQYYIWRQLCDIIISARCTVILACFTTSPLSSILYIATVCVPSLSQPALPDYYLRLLHHWPVVANTIYCDSLCAIIISTDYYLGLLHHRPVVVNIV
jgi:hypothetical protein